MTDARARSFGAYAADYAEHRPDYPADGIRWALGAARGPVHDVLDLAAGTGKLTAGLLPLGVTVTAVEPDDAMRAELSDRFPQVRALAGTAERIPLAAGSVDAVLVGQAFHWFDQPAAFAEFARVLRPGGAVGLLWNGDDDSVEWVAGAAALSGRPVSHRTTVAFPEGFAAVEATGFPHSQRRTVESYLATLATHSHLIVSPPEERAAVLTAVRDYLSARPETAGTFDLPLVTRVVRAVRDTAP